MQVVDQATADYADEQEKRASLQDSRAVELDQGQTIESEHHIKQPPKCRQCVNWCLAQERPITDGSTVLSPGYCALREEAEQEQMSQDYASQCRLFVENVPL